MIVVGRGTDPRDLAIHRLFDAPLATLAPSSDHVDPMRLAAHAAHELPEAEALAVGRHLAVCADARCLALLRDAVVDQAAVRDALYGARTSEHTDSSISLPHRQSTHSVACDNTLWETFEALAREEGCSTDWLINEAMKVYAQQRARPVATPIAPRDVTVRDAPPPPRERNTPTLQRSYLPKAPPSSRRLPTHPSSAAARPKLLVLVGGISYEVTKDRFVVGRGGLSSDLAIDDPGVSRQHALIEHAGDAYWLVDMGSTNGIEYQGQRIARRQIAHGDRFRICDHELEFLLH
ncbi:FHA domain containing protein [Minicystis rosea]|nr:FHA domain containing protein [Minicystis rosea]